MSDAIKWPKKTFYQRLQTINNFLPTPLLLNLSQLVHGQHCFPEQQYFFRLLLTLADTCICLFKKYNFGRYRYHNSPNLLLPCLNVHFYKSKYPIYKEKTTKQQQQLKKHWYVVRFGPSLLSLEPYLTQAEDKEKSKSSLYYFAFKQISQGLASKFFF